jgi:hypothetical protein
VSAVLGVRRALRRREGMFESDAAIQQTIATGGEEMRSSMFS